MSIAAGLASLSKPCRLQALPTELLQNIAANLSDDGLINLAATSRTIRSKTLHTYGERFFTTVKFCLYSHSLKVLTEISTSQFAKYVRNVAFGTEDIGLIDPLHDEDFRHGLLVHRATARLPRNEDEVADMRACVDALLLAQIFSRLPSLTMVLIADDFIFEGHPIRPSWSMEHITTVRKEGFQCPTGHCKLLQGSRYIRSIFLTVGMAIEQMLPHRKEVKLGVSLELDDHEALLAMNRGKRWYPGVDCNQRVTQLQLKLKENTVTETNMSYILELAHNSAITHLDVTYPTTPRDILFGPPHPSEISIKALSLRHLEHLVLRDLWAYPIAFVNFLRLYRDQLTDLKLIDCSVRKPNRFPEILRVNLLSTPLIGLFRSLI
jgi:hypothetical protein